jgi:hypothetical protein
MSNIFLYADESSQKVLAGESQKIISIGSDFGYGNFGDVLQHINALRAIKSSGRHDTISVLAANAISSQSFPSFVPSAYKTDAVVFVADYPLVLSGSDPKLNLVGEIRNVAGLCLYGGGFLNAMWGNFVLTVVEYFLHRVKSINYWVSGQQITSPFETRVVEHIKAFRPKLFGVRDEVSAQLLLDQGFASDFSFDDSTEALAGLAYRLSIRRGQGLALHLNSSDYTANTSLEIGLGRELASVAGHGAANHEVTVFQAFRDIRQDVFDTSETIKRLDYLFPFHNHRTIDLVGLLFSQSAGKDTITLDLEFGYSCSYHVALLLQLAGIPCWLRSSNTFYDQKSRALQVTQGLEEFLGSPKLADHSFNLERRLAWNEKLHLHLQGIEPVANCLRFEKIEDGPAPWSFYYKGRPTLQERLSEAEKANQWHRERAEGAERDLGLVRGENAELHGRVEALSAQLTEIGDEAHRQRERAEGAERDLGLIRGEDAELHGRVEALSTQLSAILASRSWRLTRGLRVLGRLFRGEFGLVLSTLRKRFTRYRS